MSSLLIAGGRLVDPLNGRDELADLRVEDGCVAAIGRLAPRTGEVVLDARGLAVTPGLIDICVHLRDPGFEEIETIQTGAQAALAGGFTAIAAMPDTAPAVDHAAGAAYVQLKGEAAGAARVYPVGALTRGREGKQLSEMDALARAGAVAFTDEDAPIEHAGMLVKAMRYAQMLKRAILTRCEDATLRGQGMVNGGLTADLMGLPAIGAGTEEVMLGRNLLLAQLEASALHLLHLTTQASMQQVASAKANGVPVTCSVTPHHLLLTEQALEHFEPVYKYMPPLRSELDRAALVEALSSGTVDAISSLHAPRGEFEKNLEFVYASPGTGGLETAFPVLHTRLVATGQVSFRRLIELLSCAPARILGVPGGRLSIGDVADMSCFNLETKWRVDPTRFLSRSKLTPYAGWEVVGRAIHVVVGGRVLYREARLST
ncbi:MAG: dihydroorotase [Planctomycetota bacterium]